VSARVGLSKLARKDIEAISRWYRDRSELLARESLSDLAECLDGIDRFPESYPLVFRDIRRARLRRFPYMILYAIRRGSEAWAAFIYIATAELDGAARPSQLVSYGRADRKSTPWARGAREDAAVVAPNQHRAD
jgi:plasmid stabilization system protein ParE